MKSVRDRRAEGAKYDEPLKHHSSDSTQEGASLAKTKGVRPLWSTIDGMLSATKEEQHAVDCVLKGDVDQYVLDGTNRSLNIPQCLLARIEQLPHQLSSGNVYKAGQLNLLCVLELMNHALQLLKEERCRVSHAPTLQINSQHLQEKCQQMARVLQDLHLLRQKITKDGIPEVRSNIKQLEAVWDRKWMDTLTDTPLVSFLNEDPALGFLSPMAQLSFEPTADANYRSSVFSQYPATLLEMPAERKSQEDICSTYSNLKSSCPTPGDRIGSPVVTTEAPLQVNTSLDWLFDTPPSAPPPQASVRETPSVDQKVSPMKNKTQILDMECDNLADQFADALTTTTPTEGRVKSLDLEGLLTALHGDPFSTRKQLPRTPESLIKDVKSSWRKAVEEDEAKKIGQSIKFNGGSGTGQFSPLYEPHNVWLSPEAPKSVPSSATPAVTSCSSPPFDQQGDLLDHETLPEMSSCDSLSLDEVVDVESEEDDELLIPALKNEATQTPLTTRQHLSQIRQASDDYFMESRKRTPECLLSDHTVSGLDRDWLMEPAKLVEATDKVFSLDLDTLETPSTPKEEYSLPKLITFSPIDDEIKC